MSKDDKKELDKAIKSIENEEEYQSAAEEQLLYITEILCAMSGKEYRSFTRYMRCERRARKHLENVSIEVE